MSGYFVLEGQDGCGKSLQSQRLVEKLRGRGHQVAHLREPGSTPVGEALRRLLLDPDTGQLEPLTEALLFFAARAELVQREVRPVLAEGGVVVAERSFVSTLVYQGAALGAAGVPRELLDRLVGAVHDTVMPDRVFVLDVSSEISAQRRGLEADRFEAREAAFHQRVREGFLELGAELDYVEIVDASRSVDAIHEDLVRRVDFALGSRR